MKAAAERWSALGSLLARADLRVLRGETRERLLAAWTDLAERERLLDDRLFVGVIGGTGVGKSTIINAIAGAEVSRSSDRRPTTDRVVAYRHRGAPLPEGFPRADLAEPEAVHDEAGLERLVLLDFPDFDSVEADHAAILIRCLPSLDALFVVADDEKYADRRLYEVLSRVPLAKANLHFLVNKTDRLALKYPGRANAVAAEIGEDFSRKLAAHAGARPEAARLFFLSALEAFRRRAAGRPADGTAEGDFPRVLDLLASYRAEKRRRAAKEENLEAQKAALIEKTRALGLDPKVRERAALARKAVAQRAAELSRLLDEIPAGALGPRERRGFHGEALGWAALKLPFPSSALASLAAGRGGHGAPEAGEVLAIAQAHYRAHEMSLKSAERELRAEVESISGPVEAPSEEPQRLRDRAEDLPCEVSRRAAKAVRFARLRAHLLPAALVLFGLWFALHPLIAETAEKLSGGEPVAWGMLFGRSLAALIAALGPQGLLFALGLVVLAYLLSALYEWRRVHRAVEGALDAFEEALRADLRADSAARLDRLTAALDGWERDRDELDAALTP